jgi:hypothetical protein
MVNPSVSDAIAYYRRIEQDAKRIADTLEADIERVRLECLLEPPATEVVYVVPPKRKRARSAKEEEAEVIISEQSSLPDEIRDYLGNSPKRVKEIARHFNVAAAKVRSLIIPENGLAIESNGWVKAVAAN